MVVRIEGSGDPVIVVPGGPGFGYRYLLPLSGLVGDEHSVVYYEPQGPRFDDYVSEVEAVRKRLGVDAVTLLGHSFGGLVAIKYATRFPERVRRLVLLESDPIRFSEWNAFREVVAARRTEDENLELKRISASADWERKPRLVESYFKILLRPYFAEADDARKLDFGFGPHTYERLQRLTRAVRAELGDWDFAQTVTAPTLAIFGERSIFPASTRHTLSRILVDSEMLTLASVGHFPHLEAPDELGRILSRFLARRPLPGPLDQS